MSRRQSVEEWARDCQKHGHSPLGRLVQAPDVMVLCLGCATEFAAEQVAQARQEWMEQIARIYQREHDALPDDKKDGQAVAAEIVAQARVEEREACATSRPIFHIVPYHFELNEKEQEQGRCLNPTHFGPCQCSHCNEFAA